MAELPGWQDLPLGGVIVNAGNAAEYLTGGWRAQRPVIDMDRCTGCLICWLYCPDVAMIAENGKFVGVDLDHCKGCGVCAFVCPPKCITLVAEWTFAEVER